MAMNRLAVIVSSTTVDLGETRRKVVEAARRLPIVVTSMETFGAASQSPERVSVERVREADVLVSLLGTRYGWIADGESKSVTEMEYLAAAAAGKIVLMYVPSAAFKVRAAAKNDPSRYIEQLAIFEGRDPADNTPEENDLSGLIKQFDFIDRVQREQHTCAPYTNSDDLPSIVVADLHRVLTGGHQGTIAYRKGCHELRDNNNYSSALYDLGWAVHLLPDDGAPAFLLALATLQGRLPRNVMRQDVQRAESLLDTSIRISPSREAYALRGAIELDYYVGKGYGGIYQQRALEHWRASQLYPANPETMELLLLLQPDLMLEYTRLFT